MSSVLLARRAAIPLDPTTTALSSANTLPAASLHYADQSDPRHNPSVLVLADNKTRHRSPGAISEVYEESREGSGRDQSQNSQGSNNVAMAAYAAAPSPPGTYVRALYDYDADDDRTSLSFRQGDVIQVITQLESGWWDGIIGGVRGWFPSNYCELIAGPDDPGDHPYGVEPDYSDTGSDLEEQDARGHAAAVRQHPANATRSFAESIEHGDDAQFWIPQATAEGHLYYFNPVTGEATPELPLGDAGPHETGPRDPLNVQHPHQTRAPTNMHDSYRQQDDDEQASEVDESYPRRPRQRRSYISEGESPTASMEDMGASGYLSRNQSADFNRPERNTSLNNTYMASGYVAELSGRSAGGGRGSTSAQHAFYDDATTRPLTWNRLVENMERAVAAYRDAVNNAERSEYVRRAEDISDHLRVLLAAGSGTTDNHSGNPSVISTNKALYPHFRDMMSKFSKLVLSSHIAAADWPAPDSYSKCLQEAEGVLNGVYGYVEVAKQQRGEEIPRLRPGFVLGAYTGGAWRSPEDTKHQQHQGLHQANGRLTYIEPEDDSSDAVKVDAKALENLDGLRTTVSEAITRLSAQTVVKDKIITNVLHEQVSTAICGAAGEVVSAYKVYIAGVEELDIKGIVAQETQVATFMTQKQALYDAIANLVISCQTVAGPLGDEWADNRGDPFETRLQSVKQVAKQLETALTKITSTLHGILELSASDSPTRQSRQIDGVATRIRSSSRAYQAGNGFGPDDDFAETRPHGDTTKIRKFFGDVPAPLLQWEADDTPSYLKLDYEGEIAYDHKVSPPLIRGGTLTALVEQLTRHDKMEPTFNSTFLLTYRSFTTAQELFELLVKRFSIQPPQALTPQEHQQWAAKKQQLVRFRVVNVLKNWIDNYWLESNDEASNDLLRRILTFATEHVASTNTGGAGPLKTSIETRLRGGNAVDNKRLVLNLSTQTPAPIVPKNMKKLKFSDIDALELARQLTIMEARLYGKIKPYECLNKTWQKKVAPGQPDPAPNIKALITQSNQLTNWVAEMILNQSDLKKRATVIKHFVAVADKCRTLNNFSTLTSIITALNTASIHRLNRTWNQVNQRTLNLLETMRKIMASTLNFSEYRETLHSANPPCIPFFGVYLTDLTFIEDGIPSVIKKTNLINFSKRHKTAEVIHDIQQYQLKPYPLQPVQELQTYISDSMKAANDVHEMYERSLQIEPREREDEKIARLLSESGFL